MVVALALDLLLTLLILVELVLVLLVLVLDVLVLDVLVLDVVVVELVVDVDEVVVEELEEVVASACRPKTRIADVLTGSEEEAEAEAEEPPEDPELEESPMSKTTMFADPEVTVTTQKSAPPAPEADSSLVTPP